MTGLDKVYQQGYRAGYLDGLAAAKSGREDLPALLEMPLEALGLSVRPCNCLHACGCQRVADVLCLSEEAIFRMRSLGKKSADEIARALHAHQLFGTAWDQFKL